MQSPSDSGVSFLNDILTYVSFLNDILTYTLAGISALMGIIFKGFSNRLSDLEKAKADSKAVDDKFLAIVQRLDKQDERSEKRDEKLDRITELLIQGRNHAGS